MLLSQLKNSIQQAKKISLTELSIQLKEDNYVIHAMLKQLIHKGLVIEEGHQITCKAKCSACNVMNQLVFAWYE